MSSWLQGVSVFCSSVSVYNGFGLRNKLRDGPLHNEKARGIFFSPCVLITDGQLTHLPLAAPLALPIPSANGSRWLQESEPGSTKLKADTKAVVKRLASNQERHTQISIVERT